MGKHTKPKRICIPAGEQAANLFEVCCEIQGVDRTDGFAIMLRPWVEYILTSLGNDPCSNIDQLAFVQDQLNEVFPQPVQNRGGYWS